MEYRRDFTIGVRETQDLYQHLVLERWRKGLVGFGAVGALVGWLYVNWLGPGLPGAVRAGVAAATALVTVAAVMLGMVVSTRVRVRRQIRRRGVERYVQSTEINGFGVQVTVGKDRARMPFDKLVRIRETGKAFYLFLSDNQAWILPKDQMEDREGESRQLREIFSTVIENARLHLKK